MYLNLKSAIKRKTKKKYCKKMMQYIYSQSPKISHEKNKNIAKSLCSTLTHTAQKSANIAIESSQYACLLSPKICREKNQKCCKSLCSILTHTAPKSDKKRNQNYCNQVIPVCVLT